MSQSDESKQTPSERFSDDEITQCDQPGPGTLCDEPSPLNRYIDQTERDTVKIICDTFVDSFVQELKSRLSPNSYGETLEAFWKKARQSSDSGVKSVTEGEQQLKFLFGNDYQSFKGQEIRQTAEQAMLRYFKPLLSRYAILAPSSNAASKQSKLPFVPTVVVNHPDWFSGDGAPGPDHKAKYRASYELSETGDPPVHAYYPPAFHPQSASSEGLASAQCDLSVRYFNSLVGSAWTAIDKLTSEDSERKAKMEKVKEHKMDWWMKTHLRQSIENGFSEILKQRYGSHATLLEEDQLPKWTFLGEVDESSNDIRLSYVKGQETSHQAASRYEWETPKPINLSSIMKKRVRDF